MLSEPSGLFRSPVMSIEPTWIDYNGHLNMAYYNVLFDRCIDAAFEGFGLGPDYIRARDASFFTAEVHVCYLRELAETDKVVCELQFLDCDAKRAHVFQTLYHADEGWASATQEQMSLHVDMRAKKVSPWPDDVMARMNAMREAHAGYDWPDRAGRRIGIQRAVAEQTAKA
ncbi:MAG: thioesterase family protein [Pseudomonadota bacterium]